LQGQIEYATDLFDASTVERLSEHLVRLLEGVVACPESRISRLPLLGEAERERLLVRWNDTARDYPQRCVHELFSEHAARTPDAVAVIFEEQSLSYAELEARSNQLAHHLVSLGVGPEVIVGLCVERSIEMVIGLLGILKAGGAYLPLDPSYPPERLSYLLNDAGVSVLLIESSVADALPAHWARVIQLDTDWPLIVHHSSEAPQGRAHADNLAYVIYTSGSTGKPKGVSVVHRNIARLVRETDYVSLSAGDRVLQLSSSTFDAATFEIWGALLNGAVLVVPARESVISLHEIGAVLKDKRIGSVFMTTALLNNLSQELPGVFSGVREVLFGGEAVDASAVRRVLEEGAPERLLHVYGPT
jgi:non-ribosomal peptide synthetase component F